MKNRSGLALLLALAVLLLVELMTACMLALATQTRLIGSSEVRNARAEAAARYALRVSMQSASQQRFDTLPPGVVQPVASGSDRDATWRVTAEHLASGMIVLRAHARVGGPGAFSLARAVAVPRVLDATAIMQELGSALSSGGPTVIAGTSDISANTAALPPAWTSSVCPAVTTVSSPAAVRAAVAPLIAASANVQGSVAIDTMLAAPDSTAIGGIWWHDIGQIADRRESGLITPLPVGDSVSCDVSVVGNWGDPSQPVSPCGGYFPLIYARGDLQVQGGAGQGILLVDGALTLTGGASFTGVVVARGGISLEPGSAIHGAVRTPGTTLVDDATVAYTACAIARALASTPAAGRLITARRTFIPAF